HAPFPVDGVVLPADLGSLAQFGAPHPDCFATAEFSGILRTLIAVSAAGVLGRRAYLQFCPDAIWGWRTSAAGQRAVNIRPIALSERPDILHPGIRRHFADFGSIAGPGGNRGGHGV